VGADNQDKIVPQEQAITADVTAGYQALTNEVNSAGISAQQQSQQLMQESSPTSPRFQQQNQCIQAAGANESAIQQCLQPLEQQANSNQQADSNAEAQALQQSAGDAKAAAVAFTNLFATFMGEGQELQALRLTGLDVQLAGVLIVDDAKIGAICQAGETASNIFATGQAEKSLASDILTWIGDYNRFATAAGLSAYTIG
jgi:hypothetical protein